MQTVLLVIHVMLVLALVGVVLLQRSEGGALGIGGGGGAFMSTRGSGNVLTRVTGYLAAAFILTSVVLAVMQQVDSNSGSLLERLNDQAGVTDSADTTTPTTGAGGILGNLVPGGVTATPELAPPTAGDAAVTPPAAAVVPAAGADTPVTPPAAATDTPATTGTAAGEATPAGATVETPALDAGVTPTEQPAVPAPAGAAATPTPPTP